MRFLIHHLEALESVYDVQYLNIAKHLELAHP